MLDISPETEKLVQEHAAHEGVSADTLLNRLVTEALAALDNAPPPTDTPRKATSGHQEPKATLPETDL